MSMIDRQDHIPNVIRDVDAGGKRLVAERRRLAKLIRRAMPAEGCGPAIPVAPARGPQKSVTPRVVLPDEKSETGYKVEETGWAGFRASQAMDIFDDLERRAAQIRDRDGRVVGRSPFTKGQVNVARLYRDLVERHEAGGMKLASLEGRAASGSSPGRDFMDAFIAEGLAIERLRAAIGDGVAMAVRRVRPTARGGAGARVIRDRDLVDAICLHGRSFRDVLERHGWEYNGQRAAMVAKALAAALDRMQGYDEVRRKKSSRAGLDGLRPTGA